MTRMLIQFAHSSLLGYLSFNSSAKLAKQWKKLNFVRYLIDYVNWKSLPFRQQNVIISKRNSIANEFNSNQLVQNEFRNILNETFHLINLLYLIDFFFLTGIWSWQQNL